MRIWMEKIRNDPAARGDFEDWIMDQTQSLNNLLHKAVLQGNLDEAKNFACELIVYKHIYEKFQIEEENKRAEEERRLSNG
jgi:hypothetical protein